jgi:hypothetical protein
VAGGPRPGGAGRGEAGPSPDLPGPAGPGLIALIIDDWGYEQSFTADFFDLPIPLTMAVIPGLPASARLARAGHAHGWEVLVHLPLQPENPQLDQGPNLIRVSQGDAEIRRLAAQGLDAIPYAVGVNNHMGSRATRDARVMNLVLDEVAARGFFFVDSRTSPASVAAEVARERGLAHGENYLFLDGKADAGAIRQNLRLLAQAAARNGVVIGIGHVRRETLSALQAELPALLRQGLRFVPVGTVVGPEFRYRWHPASHPRPAEPAPPSNSAPSYPAPTPAPVPAPVLAPAADGPAAGSTASPTSETVPAPPTGEPATPATPVTTP